jgi:hypothetical protein
MCSVSAARIEWRAVQKIGSERKASLRAQISALFEILRSAGRGESTKSGSEPASTNAEPPPAAPLECALMLPARAPPRGSIHSTHRPVASPPFSASIEPGCARISPPALREIVPPGELAR